MADTTVLAARPMAANDTAAVADRWHANVSRGAVHLIMDQVLSNEIDHLPIDWRSAWNARRNDFARRGSLAAAHDGLSHDGWSSDVRLRGVAPVIADDLKTSEFLVREEDDDDRHRAKRPD